MIRALFKYFLEIFNKREYSDAQDLFEAPLPEEPIENPQRYFWIIDPGHGARTKGKRSPVKDGKQLFEYEYNQAIAKRLSQLLTANGIDHMVTITDPENHGDALRYRVDKANSYKTHLPKIYVSIHGNAGPGEGFSTEWEGIETWYYSNIGRRIASVFQRKLIKFTGLRDRGLKKKGFYVLRKTNHPAILTENGFFNNPEEFELMMSQSFRHQVAQAHAEAIMEIERGSV